MRKLIIVNTYYQLIFAIQMKLTIMSDEEMILLISDHSNSSEQIAEKIKEVKLFEEVHFVKTEGTRGKYATLVKLEDFYKISFCKNNRYRYFIKDVKKLFFDELLVFNYNSDIYGLHAILSLHNKNIKVSRFEEGFLSYNSSVMDNTQRRIVNILRRIQKKVVINDALSNFYCFYPELYCGYLNAVSVPTIDNRGKIADVLKKCFDINVSLMEYSEKYIFFTSVYDFEGEEPIGEFDLVCRIAEKVGIDNILVKQHPRDKRNIYQEHGFKTDKNSSIPWEAIQLSRDFSKNVFLTATSGGVLAGNLMTKNKVRTYYLYKLCKCERNMKARRTVQDIEELLKDDFMKFKLEKVKIADNLDEIVME